MWDLGDFGEWGDFTWFRHAGIVRYCILLHGISGIGISESSHWIIASRALNLIPYGSNEIGGVTWHQWHPVASSLFSPCLFWFSGGIVLHFSVQRIETRNASDVFSSWRPLSMAALAEFSDVRCWDKNAFTDVTGDLGHGRIRNDHRSDYVYGHRSAVWASGFSPVGSDVRDEVWFQHLRSLKLVLSLRGRFKGLFHDRQAKKTKS